MTMGSVPIGASGLLRVAGLPIRYWLAGASPALFGLVRRLTEVQDRYRDLAVAVAERIGRDLVPHAGLSRQDRATALAIRRRLHRGEPLDPADAERVTSIVSAVIGADHPLAVDLADAARCGAAVVALEAGVRDELAREEVRLLDLPGSVLGDSPVSRTALAGLDGHPAARSDGSAPSGRPTRSAKRARQRADHLWRLVTRAATASTPRHWFGHVALVRVDGGGAEPAPLAVTDEYAAQWMDSIDTQRRALATGGVPDAEVRLAVTPLHRTDNGQIRFLVVDPLQPDQAVELSMRQTPLLSAVCHALRTGPAAPDKLRVAIARLLPEEDVSVVRGFVRHLASLGVLEPSGTPRSGLSGWGPASRVLAEPRRSEPAPDRWIDVYRRPTSPLPAATCGRLQPLVAQAMRVLTLITADTGHSHAQPRAEEAPRPLLELLGARLTSGAVGRRAWGRPPDWSPPAGAGSGFSQLRADLAERLDASTTVDIDPALLDRVGAPPAAIDWPVDALLRLAVPGAGYAAVLDQVWPAGTLDARFVDALGQLDGPVPHAEAYRRFLADLEELTGILFVELLIPPLSARAANAVRRPAYTRAWTGDADLDTYRPADGSASRYLPLDSITLRRGPAGLVAEADGRRIWPVYHATRSPLPPWDHLAELLLAAAPRLLPWTTRRLSNSLDLFPGRSHMPRITVGRELVVTAAQWRLSADDLWDPDLPMAGKIRAAARLRARPGLPRWVLLSAGDGGSVPCDLESLPGIHAVDRVRRAGRPLVVTEMLPAPDALMLGDRAYRPDDRVASELLLRLPYDELPEAMAARLARRLALPVPGRARSPPAARHNGETRRENGHGNT